MCPKNKIFWILFMIGACLRFIGLGRAQMWYDEAFTAWVSRLPITQAAQAITGDTHPPLYYALTHCLAMIGTSEIAYRSLSAIASLITLLVAWHILDRLEFTERAKLLAVGCMAIAPVQIHFAQEARMYAIFQLLILLAMLAILTRRWWLAGVWYLLALYTHNYALFYGPILFIVGFLGEMIRPVYLPSPDNPGPFAPDPRWKTQSDCCQYKQLFLSLLIPGLLFLPWLVVLAGQMHTVAGGYWIQPITPGAVLYVFYMLFWGFAMPDNWQPLSVLVALGVLGWAGLRWIQKRPSQWITILAMAMGPLVIAVIASIVWKPVLLFRGLLPSSLFIYAVIAWAMDRIRPLYRWYAAAMIIPVVVAGLWGYEWYGPTNKGDTTGTVNFIRDHWQPGDVVYHVNDGSIVAMSYYAPDWAVYKMPDCENIVLGSLSPATRQGLGIIEKPINDIEFTRAWVIWSEGPTSPACEERQARTIIEQAQLMLLIREDQAVYAGVWLYEHQNVFENQSHQGNISSPR